MSLRSLVLGSSEYLSTDWVRRNLFLGIADKPCVSVELCEGMMQLQVSHLDIALFTPGYCTKTPTYSTLTPGYCTVVEVWNDVADLLHRNNLSNHIAMVCIRCLL